MLELPDVGPVGDAAAFVVAAIAVMFSGHRLALSASALSDRFGLGDAAVGMFLLAGVTSLPEIATSFSAAHAGHVSLAVNSLLGSVAVQVMLLVLADAIIGRSALTSVAPDPVVLLQGTLCVLLLTVAALASIVGDVAFLGAGAWTWGLGLSMIVVFRVLAKARDHRGWQAVGGGEQARNAKSRRPRQDAAQDGEQRSTTRLIGAIVMMGAVILVAGVVLSQTGERLAGHTGLGASFTGATLVALATSLPEVSTVTSSALRGRYVMAISDVFGTNVINVALLFGVDLVAREGPALGEPSLFAAVGALLGVVITTLFVLGLIERRDRTIWRLGIDSIVVLLTYGGGVFLLWQLRNAT